MKLTGIHSFRFLPFLLMAMVLGSLCFGVRHATADLQSPAAWSFDSAPEPASRWHYRIPIQVPSLARRNSTIQLDVDFDALLDNLGVNGTFDINSPRIVRPNGMWATEQQYTDLVYGGATDLPSGGSERGEIRFIFEENRGPATYYLYFDIEENESGTKPAWDVNATINGNFEFLDTNRLNPPGWTGTVGVNAHAQTIENSTVTVTSASGTPASVTTAEDGNTGNRCYLMGVRDQAEIAGSNVSSVLERTIQLPSRRNRRGILRLQYRIKGWDSGDNGQTRYDFLRIQIRDTGDNLIDEIVGPGGPSYVSQPFSPNEGVGPGSPGSPGYGPYNGFSTGSTSTPPNEDWLEVVYPLADTGNNTTIVLHIETINYVQYRSWFHIDDVEWSVVNATMSSADVEAFGANISEPTTASPVFYAGDTLSVQAQVDATPTAATNPMTAMLYDPLGAATGPIALFDDGLHGDMAAGDGIWGNQAAHFFDATEISGTWTIMVYAKDGSTSQIDASNNGLIHIPDQSDTPVGQANYFNVDQETFELLMPDIRITKEVATFSDPVNLQLNPLNIPGALVTYTIRVRNQGSLATGLDTVVINDAIPGNTDLYVGASLQASGPITFLNGTTVSGLAYDPATDTTALSISDDGSSWYPWTLPLDPLFSGPDADGCISAIRYIRMNPKEVFNAASGGNTPEFTLAFKVRVR